MSERRRITESPGGWLRRSRRYSPFYRRPGLRRLPDEPIGSAFLCSVLLHAALIFVLVRVTDAPPWSLGAQTSLLAVADLVAPAAVSPQGAKLDQDRAATANRANVGRPIPSLPPASTVRAAAATSPAPRQTGASDASAVETPQISPAPIAQPESLLVLSQTAEVRAAAPEPAKPAGDGPVALLSTADVDRPLDAGWPEPPRSAPAATTQDSASAQVLTPVHMLRGSAVAETLPNPVIGPMPAPQDAAPAPRPVSADAETASSPPIITRPDEPILAASPKRPPAEADREATPASTLGLGLGRVFVRLEGPRERVTDRPTESISGRLLGGAADQLVLYVNGVPTAVSPTQRAFEVSVPLQPGSNSLRAVVTGPAGLEAEDVITVEYVRPAISDGIVLTSPADGLTLGPEDPPVVVVEGQVDDKTIRTAWIIANDRRLPVATRDGRFRRVLPVSGPLLRLWVETPPNGGAPQRSQTVTVQNPGTGAPAGVLVMEWPIGTDGSGVEVSATWRAHADRLDTPAQTVRLPALAKPSDGTPSEVFYLRGVKAGVYTLAVSYRGVVPSGDVRSTLYLPDKAGFSARPLGPVRLNGGRTVLTKVLMPYGVLWSQDDWFSGVSESVDTVTKFRVPEGISWVERKADLP